MGGWVVVCVGVGWGVVGVCACGGFVFDSQKIVQSSICPSEWLLFAPI